MEKSLRSFFLFCAGTSRDVLKLCSKTEETKHVGIGVTVLFTGLFAAISSFYALYRVFFSEPNAVYYALVLSLMWGIFVFNLDRFLVSTVRKEGVFLKDFRNVSPRILLAIVIAVVIATPLKVKIFEDRLVRQVYEMKKEQLIGDRSDYEEQYGLASLEAEESEIGQELAKIHESKLKGPEGEAYSHKRTLHDRCVEEKDELDEKKRVEVPKEKVKLGSTQNAINQAVRERDVIRGEKSQLNEELKEVQRRVTAFMAEEQKRQENSRVIGNFSRIPVIPREFKDEKERLRQRLAEVQNQESAIGEKINGLVFRKRSIELDIKNLSDAPGLKKQECDTILAAITKMETDVATALDERQKQVESLMAENQKSQEAAGAKIQQGVDEGERVAEISFSMNFLTQIEALDALLDEPYTMAWWTHWLLSILFILVETAPILVKLLTPRSPYDAISDKLDEESTAAGIQYATNHRKVNVGELLRDRLADAHSANEALFHEYQKKLIRFGSMQGDNLDELDKVIAKLSKHPQGGELLELFRKMYNETAEEALQGFHQRSRSILAEEDLIPEPV